MSKIVLSAYLINAVAAVASEVSYDLDVSDETEEMGNLIIAETCIDAGRLTTWGYPKADDEARALIATYGYDAVLTEVAKYAGR